MISARLINPNPPPPPLPPGISQLVFPQLGTQFFMSLCLCCLLFPKRCPKRFPNNVHNWQALQNPAVWNQSQGLGDSLPGPRNVSRVTPATGSLPNQIPANSPTSHTCTSNSRLTGAQFVHVTKGALPICYRTGLNLIAAQEVKKPSVFRVSPHFSLRFTTPQLEWAIL